MNIIIIGPQGSGKGTQARMIAERFGISHVSTGDMLREIARQNTDTGAHIDLLIRKGSLIPDDIVTDLLSRRLSEDDCKKGFVLDGYPRNANQAKLLEVIAKIEAVIYLKLSDEEAVKRLATRFVCNKCGEIYGIVKQPAEEGKCDACGGDLYQRNDESEFAVRRRLEIFHKDTKPLIDHYRYKRLLHEINANQSIEQVFSDISLIVENL
ncbi:MAG: nucleoside monophosphate kinase [Candidatus Aenigmarchaeota archaeon]|nr:nucleoside monophosphate kinase [Candidatus Aenigmarchaeota archaeon]